MSVTVTTQAELDAALAASEATIYIDSPDGVWLSVGNTGSAHVVAWGSAHVVAWDSAHVVAWGSAHVVAWESAHVEAGPYVAVHLHSARATVEGGVVIDIASLDLSDPTAWADFHGVQVTDGRAVVFKAVDGDLRSGWGMTYSIGATVVAADWKPTNACGAGLHFGPTPRHAKAYHEDATRFLACSIPLDAAVGITDGGIKARECLVMHEVDIDGQPVTTGNPGRRKARK